jgi:hypothetical protein
MNAKRATVRLFVAVTGLLASLLELVTGIVRLATAVLERAASVAKPRTASPTGRASTPAQTLATAPTVVAEAPPTARMTEDERLTSALMSLGFRAPNVRAFAASVRGRQAPLEVLVKEGIVALSAN